MRSKRGSYSSPRGSRRACLCKDGRTYSRKCCDGELINQGIGALEGQGSRELSCDDLILSGFSVAQDGTITLPTTNSGTIVSTTPASFSVVDSDTLRTLTVRIEVPYGYLNTGAEIDCETTATQPLSPTLTCSDITLSGFAVAQDGTITLPTVNIGTIATTSPASFSTVSVDTLRTLTVEINVPSGYLNTGSTITCTTTATQTLTLPTLACSDISISGFAVGIHGSITLPTVDIGTISSASPASFESSSPVTSETTRTLNVGIIVPSGYSNASSTLSCTTTASQTPVVYPIVNVVAGQYAAIDFDFTSSTPEISIWANDPVTGSSLADDLAEFIGAQLAEQNVSLGSTFSFPTGKNFRFYDPSNNSLAFLETQLGTGTFSFPQPATTGNFPSAPYGAGGSSNWTSRGIKFGSSGVYTTTGGTGGPYVIVDNGSQSLHHFIFHQ